MKIDVYDTYVRTGEGGLLHLNVLLRVGDGARLEHYASQWLVETGKNQEAINIEVNRYRHSETATAEIRQQIIDRGYFIIPVETSPRMTPNTDTKGGKR